MTKKLFSILSSLVLLTMLFTACAAGAAPATPAKPATPATSVTSAAPVAPATLAAPAASAAPAALTPDKIILAGIVLQDDPFMQTLTRGYTDAAAKYGVKILTANSNNDQSKETELIQAYMSQGVNGIAIAPLSKDASIANLKQAAGKGIKVAITNMSITDSSFLVGGFTSDDATNARIVGDNAASFIQSKFPGATNINVARIDFDDQQPDQSKARWDGFYSGLKAAGVAYSEVAHQSAHTEDAALAAATEMLADHTEIQIIWACNESGTTGAVQAVKQAGLAGKVFVFGYDGSDQLTRMIVSPDDILQGSVVQDPYSMGYKAIETLVNALEGKTVPDMGKITVVNGTYLGRSDPAAVNAWRNANGLP